MDPATDLISRPLPKLLYTWGKPDETVSDTIVSAKNLHLWPDFHQQVKNTLQSLNLTGNVSPTDPDQTKRDGFMIGNKQTLMARFSQYVLDPALRTFSGTQELSELKFGDLHAARPSRDKSPDVVLYRFADVHMQNHDARALAVGDILWMRALSVGGGLLSRILICQLVKYMEENFLRYSLLSTYETTVFIRRAGDYRFELSPLIDQNATSPSVHECFVAFYAMASADSRYFYESREFNPHLLREPIYIPRSHYRQLKQAAPEPASDIKGHNIGKKTILFGDDEDGIARSYADIVRVISETPFSKYGPDFPLQKAVYEVTWNGIPAIAKCWSKDLAMCYATEAGVYEIFYNWEPEGYEFFSSMLAYGQIVCSSTFSAGYIIILSKVKENRRLREKMSTEEKLRIYAQCRKGVSVLREMHVYVVDCGPHNVLYDTESKDITMVDFELAVIIDAEEEVRRSLDGPELYALFFEEGPTLKEILEQKE